MASKLLQIASHEAENQFDFSLRQAFYHHEPKLKPPFRLPFPTPQEYTQLNMAILYGVLTEPHLAKTRIKYLHAIVSDDGYGLFTGLVVKVVNELYSKLVDSAKAQLIWVTKELVGVDSVGVDGLLVSFLRQIVGGDFSEGNLWLCFELVSLFSGNWDWLVEEEPFVLTSALFTYLRVLADQCKVPSDAKLEALKQMEIEFCVRVVREHFHLCLKIGRDLIRLLQDLVHVPEFQALWKDLMLNPTAFNTPEFSGISQIYQTRTSSRYMLLRITPEMETQLRFLLTYVKFGSHKRYQIWFARKFLCRPESDTMISDIVRFICCAHHPSNDIIQSNVVQRWAVIGWLLSCCKKHYIKANVKLALFFDWLFFDERVDNIMNIEHAMLLMVHSIPKYIDFTHSLLEFLFLLVDSYDVTRRHVISRGVFSAFNLLSTKGVVQSLDVLTCCSALSPLLKEKLVLFLKAGASDNPLPTNVSDGPVSSLSLPNVSSMAKIGKSLRRTRESSLVKGNGQGGLLVYSRIGEARKRSPSVVFYVDPEDLCKHDAYFCYNVLVQGTKNVINACRKCNIKRLIYNSLADVVFDGSRDICDGDESLPNPFKFDDLLTDLKAQAEALVRFANDYDGLLTCALRSSNVFGPGDTKFVPFVVNQARSGMAKFIIGNGDNMSDFTFVENVAHAHTCAEEALVSRTVDVAGKAFFITNLEPVKFWDFVSLIWKRLGYQRPSIKIPAKVALSILLLVNGIHEKLRSGEHELSVSPHYIVHLASRTRTFKCTASKKLLGYAPVISLEEGLASTIKFFSHLSKDSLRRCNDCNEESRVDKLLGSGKVADILLWRDEKTTFACFLTLAVLFYWFFLSGSTFVSAAANLLMLATVILYVCAILPLNICGFSTQKISLHSFEISEKAMLDSMTAIANLCNRWVHTLRSMAEGKDWCIFFQALASIYFLKMISLYSTVMIGAVIVLSLTSFFIYSQYESEMDQLAKISINIAKKTVELSMGYLPK